MFGRNAYRRYMSCVIRFNETNDEANHDSTGGYRAIGYCLRGCEQVIKSLTTVGLTVDKASLIESPAFVQLRNRQRTNVIPRTPRRSDRLLLLFRRKRNFRL